MATRWYVDGLPVENLARDLMTEMASSMSLVNGQVSMNVGEFDFLADSLFGLIEHHYSIDDETLYGEFLAALRECFRADEKLSDAKSLLARFDKRCGALLSKRSDYVFISSLNLAGALPKARTINGCLIKFHRTLPRHFRKARATLLQVKNPIKVNDENEGYLFVEVRVSGVNDLAAFEAAMEALAIYRGLVQLHVAKKISLFAGPSLSHRYPAEATVKLGNIHTMHRVGGEPAREAHWYEDFPNASPPTTIAKFKDADDRIGRMLQKIQRAPLEYQEFCTKFILAYTNAMDTRDEEAKLVKFWLCLELLTGADDAKNIIKRIAFFYSNQKLVTAQLRALRAARNSHVHAGTKPVRLSLKNFMLVEFIENLIVFVVSNHFKFETRQQWWDFMSTTTDIKSIDQQISRLKMVKKFALPSSLAPAASAGSSTGGAEKA